MYPPVRFGRRAAQITRQAGIECFERLFSPILPTAFILLVVPR